MKRLWKGLAIGLTAFLLVPSLLALAYSWYIDFTVTESLGTAYTSLPIGAPAANTYYSTNGYISATGLNTRVYDSANSTMPHMLTEDTTWFAASQPANNSQVFRYALGDTALSAFNIIPGYSGNITTSDNANLELGGVFDISVSGYFNTTGAFVGSNILQKDNAVKLDISAVSTVTFHALNGGGTDNWTLSAAGVTSGVHLVRVVSNGVDARIYVDGVEKDSESLLLSNMVGIDTNPGTYAGQNAHTTFYEAGRYWVFYVYQTNVYLQSSLDGSAWSGRTQVSSDNKTDQGSKLAIWFDGTYVHYARSDTTGTRYLYYRRGLPQADGSMTWSAAEQTVTTGSQLTNLAICVNSSGNAFIAYSDGTSCSVTRNNNTDGTWSTSAGNPVYLGSAAPYTTSAHLTSLATSGAVYSARNNADGKWFGRYYNGTSWSGSEESLVTVDWMPFHGLTYDNSGNVFFAYRDAAGSTSLKIRYAGGGMSSAISINSGLAYNPTAAVSYLAESNQVVVFYTGSGGLGLYYKIYDNGTVSSSVTLASGTTNQPLSASVRSYDSAVGILTGYNTSNTVLHAFLQGKWVWQDNGNSWAWMAGNSMSYADNMTLDVSGVRRLTYLPDAMILGTTLPDESGNGNDGTFSWGTNPVGVTVASGPLVGGTPPHTPTPPTAPWELVPTVPAAPADLFTEGGECMPGLAELAAASEATGNPRAMFPIMLAFGLAILAGFGVYGATHNSRVGQRGSIFLQAVTSLAVLIFFYVGGCGVIPGWVLIPFGIEAVFLLVGRNPQHSST